MSDKLQKISESKYTKFVWYTIFAFAMLLYVATFVVGIRTFAIYTPIFGVMYSVEKYILFLSISSAAIVITLCLFVVNIFARKLSAISMIGVFALNIVNVAMPYLLKNFDIRIVTYAYIGYISFTLPLSLLFILLDLVKNKARGVGYAIISLILYNAIAIFNLVYLIAGKNGIGSAIISVGIVPVLCLVTILTCILQAKFEILSVFGMIRQFVVLALGGLICAFSGMGALARIIFAALLVLNSLMGIYETIRYSKLSKEVKNEDIHSID